MPPRLRALMLVGLGLALIGVVGLAATVGGTPGQGVPPRWFIPFYVAGSLLLVGSGVAWLVQWTRRRPPE